MQCDLHLQLAAGGSHRTLLYGQAVLFLHSYSSMVSADATQKQAYLFICPVVFNNVCRSPVPQLLVIVSVLH